MRARRITTLAVSAVAGVAALVGSAPDARAGMLVAAPTSCPDVGPAKQAFAPWGDDADYVLAPGGGFEAGGPAWTLANGARLVADNSPFYVRAPGDRQALSLPPGASAVSRPMCLGEEHPTFRAFARATGPIWDLLKVELVYWSASGAERRQLVGVLVATDHTRWAPAASLMAAKALPLLPGETTPVAFRFTNLGRTSTWTLDDVYVDPYVRR